MTRPADHTQVRRRTVTVTALDAATSTATITYADGITTTVGVPYLQSYLPAVGDVALLDLLAGSPVLVGTASLRRVGCRLRRVAAQSVANGGASPTNIAWDTEDSDPYGFVAVTSATVTVPAGYGGTYAVTFRDSGTFGGRSFVEVVVTAAATGVSGAFRYPADAAASLAAAGVPSVPLAAGDSFVCGVYQTSGGAQNHTAWLNLLRIGP